jgi:hypothetical protein
VQKIKDRQASAMCERTLVKGTCIMDSPFSASGMASFTADSVHPPATAAQASQFTNLNR